MKHKSLTQFVQEHRAELDQCILDLCPNARLNDTERRQWVLNDEGLYLWARSEGVPI